MPKVTEAHRESRRTEILDAARRCFANNGFHATSMQDILDESCMSAGALYRYFPGKSGIVAAIAGENVVSLFDSLSACAEQSPDLTVADAVITALTRVRAKNDARGTALVALQVWAESARDPDLCQHFASTHEGFRTIVAGMIARRHPELADDADVMAGAVAALVPGFILQLSLLDGARTADFERGVRLVLGDL